MKVILEAPAFRKTTTSINHTSVEETILGIYALAVVTNGEDSAR